MGAEAQESVPVEAAPPPAAPPPEATPAAGAPTTADPSPVEAPAAEQAPSAQANGATPEAPAAPKGEQADVDIFDPATSKMFDELGLAGESPGKFSREEIQSWAPELRQVYMQMQRGVQQKYRDLAEQRKSLVAEQDAQKAAEARVQAAAQEQFKHLDDESLAEYLKAPEGAEPEAWDIDARVEWQTRKVISKLIGGYHNRLQELGQQQQHRIQHETKVAELTRFIEQNPDFPEFKNDIIEYRKQYPAIPAQDAYTLLRARRAARGDQQLEARLDKEAAGVARPGTSPSASAELQPPAGLSGSEIAQWFEAHPKAHAAYLKKIRSGLG